MMARIGEPVRMSSETSHNYVAHLKRVSDAPPNQGTQIAFQPEVDKVHSGVRVSVLSSELKGQALYAKIVIEENRLVAIHTARYTEGVKPKPPADPAVARASLRNLARLNPAHAPSPPPSPPRSRSPRWIAGGRGSVAHPQRGGPPGQPGPCTRHDGVLKKQYEEKLIAITAPAHRSDSCLRPGATPRPGKIPQPITGACPGRHEFGGTGRV